MKKLNLLFFLIPIFTFCQNGLFEHQHHFTRQDSLRGGITTERSWWDLTHYNLAVEVFPKTKRIEGTNTISFKVLRAEKKMQIDLQEPLQVTQISYNNKPLEFEREGNVFWIYFPTSLPKNSEQKITIAYEGKPKISKNPPWSGGITWRKDEKDFPFIASSNQGIGASIWWPNKDHSYDEPDNGIDMHITVPDHLINVSNGRLVSTTDNPAKKTKTFHWQVTNPINNYGVNINIGNYTHFSETFEGEKGNLDCEYWVLQHNLKKAKKQFKQAKMTLKAFEYWFGPYPFYEDSYKLVEAPYLGMEHQSSVTYGNKYKNGYLGSDLSGTGVGLKFDFIIIHETGHEWFANNITHFDVADMWIHESFTAYSESLFVEYHFTKKEAEDYVLGTKRSVKNDKPIIGVYHVNHEGSGDMYYKGANMIHTLRHMINNDTTWRTILRGLNNDFFHQQVTSHQVEQYIEDKANLELSAFFNQYLRTTQIPALNYSIKNNQLYYHFSNTVKDFNIPVKVYINNQETWLSPTNQKQILQHTETIQSFKIDRNFYMNSAEQ